MISSNPLNSKFQLFLMITECEFDQKIALTKCKASPFAKYKLSFATDVSRLPNFAFVAETKLCIKLFEYNFY